jgi:hypothetical protein
MTMKRVEWIFWHFTATSAATAADLISVQS